MLSHSQEFIIECEWNSPIWFSGLRLEPSGRSRLRRVRDCSRFSRGPSNLTPKAFGVDEPFGRSNLIPFHASHSQKTFPGRKTENQKTFGGRNNNKKETRARRETESATALGFTAG
jgi:hypothetical protein